MKKPPILLIIGLLIGNIIVLNAQANPSEKDARTICQIYDLALTEGSCYEWLHHLCKEVGGRLAGSPQSAVEQIYQD